MIGMSSTLVETVSINYEDFNESFLTCGTCLCMYDGSEHTPKLLPCSHTVCLHCLTRIAASQTRDNGTFRCPICRKLITIPRGGVSALPPSFLVNQLLDLMSRQRREVIPKCSIHLTQELLFCETCDTVFCSLCTGSTGHSSSNEHTIIPFSIAIKRMSEILLYKANECISKLAEAQETVKSEIQKINVGSEKAIEKINDTINELNVLIENRRQEMLNAVSEAAQEKKKVLEEQLAIIEGEKNKVENECDGLQYQVEVRNITQKISSLGEKLDAASSLSEPRENSFLTCDFTHNDSLLKLAENLKTLGRVRTSTTYPSLCTYDLCEKNPVANLETCVILNTVDYHGNSRSTGGDPVTSNVTMEGNPNKELNVRVEDLDNGTYKIYFRPPLAGKYLLNILVFDRVIRGCPIPIDVTDHNNPITTFGMRGCGKDEFLQPVAIAVDKDTQYIYVVDTGNSRIKILNKDLEFIRHIYNEGLEGRSCTGIDVCKNYICIVNWRTKTVTTMNHDGITMSKFSYDEFQEPIDISIDSEYGHYLIADSGLSCVFVFDSLGKLLFQVGKKGNGKNECFNLISSICVGPNSSIIVADTSIHIYSPKGDLIEEINSNEVKSRGRYGGLSVDKENRIVVVKTEKNKNVLQVLKIPGGEILSTIDSYDSKLKRPGGISVTNDNHVVVVDLGYDLVRKYRYW
ncbi:RING finger-containing protein, putative [Pediculus humanus corporis]|uniref:RING finger-containing protein, putative n=1 Tax=Pediculus humanus subsp. corporis TaxID=121224 RepID=E0W0L9_PEDHC|nr:RING finger-containing protein, putative [Pediculus humanus corporis]EEB19175.1 RING finger-containing protein, putative [Pediculus humanus corporis]